MFGLQTLGFGDMKMKKTKNWSENLEKNKEFWKGTYFGYLLTCICWLIYIGYTNTL